MEGHSSRGTMDIERRHITDHRRAPTRPLSRYSLWGRRKKARREGEDRNYYVDRYEPRYFILISLILALCVLDAYFTLKIIDFGGKELNRLMLIFVYKKPISALVFKYLVTAVSIIFILIHKNFIVFGKIKVFYLIYVFFSVYLTLVAYEAIVFFNHIRALSF
jgi:hypothetical protein